MPRAAATTAVPAEGEAQSIEQVQAAKPARSHKRKSVTPVVLGQFDDAQDHETRQPPPRVQRSTGPARESLDPLVIETVDRPVDKEWAAAMAFNEEKVEVMVHDTDNKMADSIPDIYVNGVPQRFIRGQRIWVKRKFVELLGSAKIISYTQEKRTDNDGNEYYVNIPHVSLKYPFSVIADKSPRAHEWLAKLMERV